ncbi:uncharacterized protein [Antedon mediterranea]|uniref:uncharacterized protein n=1 Tax=Antedon mediterranea TaxID=105859 RepID=UPI003AF46C63
MAITLTVIYALGTLFSYIHDTNARAVVMTPMDPILAAGSNLNITCTLDASTTYTSRDIIWTTSFGKDTDRIDPSKIDIISDSEAMLRLQNLTMANYKDQYHCYLPDSSWHGTYVYVGMAPTKPTLNCSSTNTVDYVCKWSEIENTNLRDTYTFEFETKSSWQTCPEKVGEFGCKVSFDGDEANLNSGIGHGFRVNVTNFLGKASTQIYFYPETAQNTYMPIAVHENPQTSMQWMSNTDSNDEGAQTTTYTTTAVGLHENLPTSMQWTSKTDSNDAKTGYHSPVSKKINQETSAIYLYILIPIVIILTFVLIAYIYKHKYHDKYFKPWPEPKFTHVVIDPELSPPPTEKETFDELKKRPNNKSTIGSTASSDQGFHDMSNFSQIEEKTSYKNELNNYDDTFYPAQQGINRENENMGKAFFHINYAGNFVNGEMCYQYPPGNEINEEFVSDYTTDTSNSESYTNMPSTSTIESIIPSTSEDCGYVPMLPNQKPTLHSS